MFKAFLKAPQSFVRAQCSPDRVKVDEVSPNQRLFDKLGPTIVATTNLLNVDHIRKEAQIVGKSTSLRAV